MNNLVNFTNKTIQSTELVDIINEFRGTEDNKAILRHDSFMTKIRKEIEALAKQHISGAQNFLETSYMDSQGKNQPCYKLNRDGMLQMLNSESAFVRYRTIEYINKLEKVIQSNLSIGEFKGQLTTFVTDLFKEKLEEVEQYYKINSSTKCNLVSYIKNRLGINRANEEYELVKERVFLLTGITKLEDISFKDYKDILPVIDESIRIIKMDRPSQVSFFD